MDFMNRLEVILNNEQIYYDKKVVASLIQKFFPDWRRVLNELQRYSASGKIDAGILVNLSEDSIKELLTFLKGKEFTNVRRWIVNNLDNDPIFIVGFTIPFMIVWCLLLSPMLLLYLLTILTSPPLSQTKK